MGCCLLLAFVMAVVVRPLRRGSGNGGFPPAAARGTSAEPLAPAPLASPFGRPRATTPPDRRSAGLAASVRVGIAVGLLVHASLVSLLLATGVVEAQWLSPWLRAAALGGVALVLTLRAAPPGMVIDPAAVAVVGGGSAFAAGLVDMHALGAFAFDTGPSLAADLLLHGWPLLLITTGAALELRRPRQPLAMGAR